jgi:hypothetical protein
MLLQTPPLTHTEAGFSFFLATVRLGTSAQRLGRSNSDLENSEGGRGILGNIVDAAEAKPHWDAVRKALTDKVEADV